MCAPCGSGKSTHARALKGQGYVRLSIDGAAWEQGYRAQPLPDGVSEAIAAAQKTQLLDLVRAGRDVVLDYSFYSRAFRDEYRALLAPLGVVPEVVYVRTPRELGLERMRERNVGHPDDFCLPEEVVEMYWDGFEVPTEEEGPIRVVDGY